MRAAVLASPASATPSDHAPARGLLARAPLPEGGGLRHLLNLSRGAVWAAGSAPPDAALAGRVHLRGASGATRLAGELRAGAGAGAGAAGAGAGAAGAGAGAGAGEASSRLELLDEWLDAEAWLDPDGAVTLEVEAPQGLVSRVLREPPPRPRLRLTPTEARPATPCDQPCNPM